MALQETWRWFGPNDPITLREIKQTGADGIVTALHHIPVGGVWTVEEISKRKRMVESEGMSWSVAESIPVHEEIKMRRGNHRSLTETYIASIRNLGACGIDTVCYNFMPVLDWSRTDLEAEFSDGSITTRFEAAMFAAFDCFVLKRAGAEADYSTAHMAKAKSINDSLDDYGRERLIRTILLGFPGSRDSMTLDQLRSSLESYRKIGDTELREHLITFLRAIVPAAEESGVRMALHPDDPPWPLLGLPRVVSDSKDVDQVLAAIDSPSNGITLCTGSFGASARNDLVKMAERFARRINFVHFRNVKRTSDGDFIEDNHLDGEVDMYGVMKALLLEQKRRADEGRRDIRIPFRPDHGHLMLADRHWKNIYPGYSLFGRMRGLAELRGLQRGIGRSLEF